MKALRLVLATAFAPLALLSAAEARIEKRDIFTAGEAGYAHFRIPGIVATPKGTLLTFCEARKESGGDWGQIDILMRRSTDGGKTWSPMRKIIEPPADARRNEVAIAQNLGDNGGITANNPLAIVDEKTGAVHFLYCIEYARCFYKRSDDEGENWSEAVEITGVFEEFKKRFPWKVLATGPGHGIQLVSGRLLVPVWLSTGTGGHAHRPSVNATIYSDDHGKTWQAGAIAAGEFNPDNPSETAAIELADGRVMLNFRHESPGRGRAVVFSPDGISDWSPVQYDGSLPEPVCMASLVRLSKRPESNRNRILFSNPNNPVDRRRWNVTVRLSYDEGETWPISKSIDPGMSGYSDLAVSPDGTIHCLYERGTVTGNQYNIGALCVASFNLEWLTDGLDQLGRR